jgi:hypothetical protein
MDIRIVAFKVVLPSILCSALSAIADRLLEHSAFPIVHFARFLP